MEKENSMLPYHLSQQSVRFEILLQYLPHNREEVIKSNQIKLVMLCCAVLMFVFMLKMMMITITMTMVGNNYNKYNIL